MWININNIYYIYSASKCQWFTLEIKKIVGADILLALAN